MKRFTLTASRPARAWRRPLLAIVATTAMLCACSVVADFSGLTGDGAGSDATAETSSPANDAATTDSSTHPDAKSTADATPTVPFCADAANYAFCTDFDDAGPNFNDTWDTVTINPGGSLAIDTKAWVSAPASLLSTLPIGATGNVVLLRKNFVGHTRAVISADMRLDAVDNDGYGSLLEIHLMPYPSGFTDYRVALIQQAGQMTLDVYSENAEGGTVGDHTAVKLDFSQWQRVSIEMSMNPNPHATAYDANGVAVATLPLVPFQGASASTGQFVTVGLPYLRNNTAAWAIRHDNVSVSLGD